MTDRLAENAAQNFMLGIVEMLMTEKNHLVTQERVAKEGLLFRVKRLTRIDPMDDRAEPGTDFLQPELYAVVFVMILFL